MSTSRVLTQQLSVRCIAPGPMREIDAEFRYDVDDPYAVALTFHLGDDVLRWDLARCVLAEGMTDPSGQGDVCLWPQVTEEGRAIVMASLFSTDGDLVGEIRTNQLYRFITRTLALVPLGTESDWLDIDGAVAQLLRSGAQ